MGETEMAKLTTGGATLQATQLIDDSDKKKTTAKVVLENIDQQGSSGNFERIICNFDANFSKLLVTLLDKIMDYSIDNCGNKLMNILYRLDFNGFYTEQLETVSAERSLKEASDQQAGASALPHT